MHIYLERKAEPGHFSIGLWKKLKVCPKPSECQWDLGSYIPSVSVEIPNLENIGYKS